MGYDAPALVEQHQNTAEALKRTMSSSSVIRILDDDEKTPMHDCELTQSQVAKTKIQIVDELRRRGECPPLGGPGMQL